MPEGASLMSCGTRSTASVIKSPDVNGRDEMPPVAFWEAVAWPAGSEGVQNSRQLAGLCSDWLRSGFT